MLLRTILFTLLVSLFSFHAKSEQVRAELLSEVYVYKLGDSYTTYDCPVDTELEFSTIADTLTYVGATCPNFTLILGDQCSITYGGSAYAETNGNGGQIEGGTIFLNVSRMECDGGSTRGLPVDGFGRFIKRTYGCPATHPVEINNRGDGQPFMCDEPKYFVEDTKPKSCPAGNPCSLGSGVKTQVEDDFVSQNPNGLSLIRTYSSDQEVDDNLGKNWRHNYSSSLTQNYNPYKECDQRNKICSASYHGKREACIQGGTELLSAGGTGGFVVYENESCKVKQSGKVLKLFTIHSDSPEFQAPATIYNQDLVSVKILQASGNSIVFERIGASWVNAFNPKLKLIYSANNWILIDSNGQQKIYNDLGQLIQIISRGGITQSLEYNLSVIDGGDDNPQTLDRVSEQFGQRLQMSYDENGNLNKVVTPKGTIDYQYDVNENLSQVTFEDGQSKNYVYDNADYPNLLTGIIDQNDVRFATWVYDSKGRAILSEHAGGAEAVTFEFLSDGKTKTTDVLGASRTYKFDLMNGRQNIVLVEGEPCQVCNHGNYKAQTYNHDGQLATQTDWNGVVTRFEYTNQFLTKKTIAFGKPEATIITTTWDESLQLPTQIVKGNQQSTMTYDDKGNLLTQTVTDLATSLSRTTTLTYDLNGQVTSVDGPRNDVSDITYFEYDTQARLIRTINALGHTTEITEYDEAGLPLTLIHPNNVIEQRSYSLRGWLLTQSFNGATTQYDYDKAGQVVKITSANGITQQFEYDDVRRLTTVVDGQGNRTEYTVDLAGNVTQTKIIKLDGTVTFTQTSEYDKLSQLTKTISGQSVENTFEYDTRGSLVKSTNGLLNSTSSTLDALARLKETLDPELNKTQLSYDNLGNLKSVIDAEDKSTTYQYNAFGDLTKLISPDTGTTNFTYDNASNLLTKTDARGVTVTFTYDALNRLLTQSYSNTAENIVYSYDDTADGNKGIGRLTHVTDQSGSTDYFYNAFGQVTKVTQVIQGHSFITEYLFDVNGQLTDIIYPNGRSLTYVYNSLGQLSGMTTTYEGVTQNIATNMQYLPFGPLKDLTYGNGLKLSQTFDMDYRLTNKLTDGTNQLNYNYDPTNNITAISDALNQNQTKNLTYDPLSRLLNSNNATDEINFSYDKIGNRLTKTHDSIFDSYTYESDSHRLASVSGSNNSVQYFDEVGNTITRGDLSLTYSQRNRLETATQSGMDAFYLYNYKGERVAKTVNGLTTYFVFDLQGQLIAESDEQGAISVQYIYLNGQLHAIEKMGSSGAAISTNRQEVVLDDSDAELNGNWQSSTSVSGYIGSRYLHHAANAPSNNGVIIDNDQAVLSGNWISSRSVAGYWGSEYTHHAANQPAGGIILDSENSDTTILGDWKTSTSVRGYNGSNYLAGEKGSGEKQVSWNLASINYGEYQVYARWTSHSNRASNASYQINHSYGNDSVVMNQRAAGNQWNLLGSFTLDPASSITIDNNTDGWVIADAIMLVPVGASPNMATWNWQADNTDTYKVYARWTAHANRASNAIYTITSDAGVSQSVVVSQKQNGGSWNLLASLTINQGDTVSVSLTDQADGYVIADAIQIVAESEDIGNQATWQLADIDAGQYEVYANWTQHANRASNAKFSISHQNGTDTVSVNQTQNGGSWQLLGTFDLNNQSQISLSDKANGYVIADGIKLVPVGEEAQVAGIYYVHTDHLGTPIALTDGSTNIQWKAHYTPFGKATVEVNSIENNIRFPGQYFDAETGLHYNYFRDYDPEIGRYIQSDPIGLAGGINTYGYVGGNPVNFYDPKGLNGIAIAPGIGLGIGIALCAGSKACMDALRNALRDLINATNGNGDGNNKCQTFYRGDVAGLKEFWAPIIQEGGYPSDAARLIKIHGFQSLAEDHASGSYGSPYISITTNLATAQAYAGTSGQVYEITLPPGMATFNPYNHNSPAGRSDLPDDEWLVPIHIPSNFVDSGSCGCGE